MVRSLTVEAPCELDADAFWARRWELACERYALSCEGRSLELLHESQGGEDGDEHLRTVKVVFKDDPIPPPLRHFISSDDVVPIVTWTWRRGRHDEPGAASLSVAMPGLGDRVSISGAQWLQPREDGTSCTLVSRFEIGVRMPFGVGGLVENVIADEYQLTYKKLPARVAAFCKRRANAEAASAAAKEESGSSGSDPMAIEPTLSRRPSRCSMCSEASAYYTCSELGGESTRASELGDDDKEEEEEEDDVFLSADEEDDVFLSASEGEESSDELLLKGGRELLLNGEGGGGSGKRSRSESKPPPAARQRSRSRGASAALLTAVVMKRVASHDKGLGGAAAPPGGPAPSHWAMQRSGAAAGGGSASDDGGGASGGGGGGSGGGGMQGTNCIVLPPELGCLVVPLELSWRWVQTWWPGAERPRARSTESEVGVRLMAQSS